MWREQTYLHPRAVLGYFPCNSDGNELIVWDPQDFDPAHPRELERLVFPASPSTTASAWPTSIGPVSATGETDVVALQAVTTSKQVTELMARLGFRGRVRQRGC